MRKTKATDKYAEAVETFEIEAEVRGELADAAIELQDAPTKKLIERMVKRLQGSNKPSIIVSGEVVPVSETAFLANLRYVATEVLKDLAVFDIRVGTYALPSTLCVSCGVEIDG